jgi:chromosome segregation ATPase
MYLNVNTCSIRTAVAQAEEAKAMFSSQATSGKSNSMVAALMKAAKKGGPLANAGVRGRLGDLGSIAPEYDVAVSTASGALDYVVVDTSEGGNACLQYLKEHQLGRATFILLDKVNILIPRWIFVYKTAKFSSDGRSKSENGSCCQRSGWCPETL